MSNEEELRKIIEESEVLAPYLKDQSFKMPPYSLTTENARECWEKDKEAWRKEHYTECVLSCAFDIRTWVLGTGGSFSSSQTRTPEAHQNKFTDLSFALLEAGAKNETQEIEDLTEAKGLLSKLIDADAKAQWEINFTIALETPNRRVSWMEHDWDKHELKIKGKAAVLEMASILHEKILAVYEAEKANRLNSSKVHEIVKNMTSLVKKAEKIRPIIVKANLKALKVLEHCRPDIKTCRNFIEATSEFSDLSNQYFSLKSELAFYTNETLETPAFPELTSTDTSAKSEIEKDWRRSD